MGVYELLQQIVPQDTRRLHRIKFTKEQLDALESETDRKVVVLLSNISSLGVRYGAEGIEFHPEFRYSDGTRTFALEDLTNDDLQLLYSLEADKLPLLLQARISVILWSKNADYKMALKASSCYYELYLKSFDSTNWTICYNHLVLAVRLAAQINSKDYPIYLQNIADKIIELNGEDSSILSILLTELLLSQKKRIKFDALMPAIDKIILNSSDNIHKSIRAYKLKSKIYFRQGDSLSAMGNNIRLASYLENKADSETCDSIQSLFHAEQYLQQSVHLYRNNAAPEDGKRVHSKLLEIQEKIPQNMIPISVNRDMTKEYESIKALFEGLSFKESLMRITQCTPLYERDYLKQRVLKEAADPLSCLFESGIKSSRGRTIATISPIDMKNPTADKKVLEKHMHHTALFLEEIHGMTILKWVGDILNSKFQFTPEDLGFLVKNNPIIPVGRENIFLAGLYYGLKGNIYMSLHVLAPQIEHLFRCIAESAGAIMSTLEDDDTSDAKLLTSVFDSPELIECYDNDIIFLFKGLLNEKTGANIRNKIAHGIMGEQEGSNGAARFFLCWVLKLLSFTSIECWEIIRSSEKLSEKSK